jgi:DUF4097 and DUF4098 domain-containing protein YvlB
MKRYRALTAFACAALILPAAASAQTIRVSEHTSRAVARERATTVAYQRGENRQELTDRTTRVLRIGASGELDVSNIAGDIVVTRNAGNEASVEIVKTARARTPEDAREMLGLVTVEVSERNGRGEVRTRYPQGDDRRNTRRNINVSVAYTIAAPANARLTVKSISGNISVTDIKGDLSLETVSGDVQIGNAGRITSAKSVSGGVQIADTRVDGALEASSVSGNVAARRVEARRLALGSVSGNVILDTVTCERADANTVSGDVEFSGPIARSGRYELKSHSGDVRVAVAGGAGFEVDASSWSGSVRADMPLTLRTQQGERDRHGRSKSIKGTFGDGSAFLTLTTFSGSIVITRR